MRHLLPILLVCGCDFVFRLDRIEPGDAPPDVDPDAAVLSDARRSCGADRDGVVAYYPIDGDGGSAQLTDHGVRSIHGGVTPGTIATTTGPAGCGEGLLFEAGREVTIAHDDAFQLASGSIDLWVRPIPLDSTSPTRVIVARDAGANNRGDFALFLHRLPSSELILVARLQSGSAQNGGGTLRCSQVAVVAGIWYHAAVSFGPPGLALYVDGAEQTRTTTLALNGEQITCGASTTGQDPAVGLDGTPAKAWFLGFGDVFETSVVRRYLSSGAIDHFRVTNQRI